MTAGHCLLDELCNTITLEIVAYGGMFSDADKSTQISSKGEKWIMHDKYCKLLNATYRATLPGVCVCVWVCAHAHA